MKKQFLLALTMAACSISAYAQKKIQSDIYRRNSLCTYFLSDIDLLVSERGVDEEIRKYLDNYVVSDKFDDIIIGNRYVSVRNVQFTDDDRAAVDPKFAKSRGKKTSGFGSVLNSLAMSNPDYGKMQAEQRAMDEKSFFSSHPEIFSAKTTEEYKENTYVMAAKDLQVSA